MTDKTAESQKSQQPAHPALRSIRADSVSSLGSLGSQGRLGSLSDLDLSFDSDSETAVALNDLHTEEVLSTGMKNGLTKAASERARRAWRKVVSLAKILIHYNTRYSHQVAGHKDTFLHPARGILCKRTTELERDALSQFMTDSLREFVPRYDREVFFNGERYIQMEDLLANFQRPCLMDIKMGQRTFLESEVKNSDLRSDLLAKMREIDPNEPTPEENARNGITKLRYMQFREQQSSSANLGFRIEGIKIVDKKADTNFKTIKEKHQVQEVFKKFISSAPYCKELFSAYLERILERIEQSEFFRSHEIVGSSLLFVYDFTGRHGIWLIDFAKTSKSRNPLTHRIPWQFGNQEDGYLIGLDMLTQLWKSTDISDIIDTVPKPDIIPGLYDPVRRPGAPPLHPDAAAAVERASRRKSIATSTSPTSSKSSSSSAIPSVQNE